MSEHRWKNDWPGNFCLDCGLDDPLETALADGNALIDCDCKRPADLTQKNGCPKCLGTGAIVNPAIVIPPCSNGHL